MIPEGWRLVMYRTTERWLEPKTEGDPPRLIGGLELPAGARIHSIHPVATERIARHQDRDSGSWRVPTDYVVEWAVFVAVPPEEVA